MSTMLSPVQIDLVELRVWVIESLPRLNSDIRRGISDPEDLIHSVLPSWDLAVNTILRNLPSVDASKALEALQVLAFPVSSLESHFQSRGLKPGAGVASLPDTSVLFEVLGRIAQHPPRDTHYTFWRKNRNQPLLSFTGDVQEAFFNRQVNLTDDLHAASCEAMRPICMGIVHPDSDDALEALAFALENTREVSRSYGEFFRPVDPNGQPGMTPEFFTRDFRTYLTTYPIGSQMWEGVNAANIPSQMQFDYLLGIVDRDFYDPIVEGRLRFLTAADRNRMQFDMSISQTVLDVLLMRMSLSRHTAAVVGTDELVHRILTQSLAFRRTLETYRQLVRTYGSLSARHWTMIQNFLVKYAQTLAEKERGALAVDPGEGTGGKAHEVTRRIMEMRSKNELVNSVCSAIEIAAALDPIN